VRVNVHRRPGLITHPMSSAGRAIRRCFLPSSASLLGRPPPPRLQALQRRILSVQLPPPHHPRSFSSATPAADRPISARPQRGALDPLSFFVAAVLSAGIAYVVTKYHPSEPAAIVSKPSREQHTVGHALAEDNPKAAMAAQMPPGRPGNLTPEQEEKLKEMWAHTLDIFGVSRDEANGSATTPSSKRPESHDMKKKKSRLSMFRKKDKNGAAGEEDGNNSNGTTTTTTTTSSSSAAENDKHGQTKAYREALASHSPDELRDAFWSMTKHDHPDALLLRFLRARKWDVQAAMVMMISTGHWRVAEMHVDDDIMVNGEERAWRDARGGGTGGAKKEGEDFMAQLRMGKSFFHGVDREGRPCCYVRVRLHRGGEQTESSLERFTVYLIETGRMMLRPPVDTATIVFDMTDFSMANMDYTPVKFMIKCFEANYPESLGSVLVYKAPWIFNAIWKVIRGWLDPVVASKVHFASNVEELQEWIPKGQIMKELGGDEEYEYSYIEPVEGENQQMLETSRRDELLEERKGLVKYFEDETVAWTQGEEAGGRTRLAQRLTENYWRLDPYVRAKSLYDRQGVLGPDGTLVIYPKKDPAETGADDVD